MNSPRSQLFSTIGLKLDLDTPMNERARLNTGFLCNYGCEFCYYKDRLTERDSLDVIKERVDDIYNYGIRQIDLSGGESSVEPNWFKILDYCREKEMTISTLTHGGKFCDYEFLKKSKEHGLTEILFSMHGSNPEVHDKITNRKRSFERIVQAIKNAHDLGIIVRLNCTVYDLNHEYLKDEYVELLKELKPFEINFICLNYDTDNGDFRQIDYNVITTSIKNCIDQIENVVPIINVRYVPYCYMEGYEKHVVNYYQHIYDIYDWNLAIYNHNIDTSKTYSKEEKIRQSMDAAKHFRMNAYNKSDDCKKCKHYFICDGIEKQLDNNPFKPQEGEKIYEINHYRKDFFET
jgi:radical SAM protein with 4Fe4S-binding SPASM domain